MTRRPWLSSLGTCFLALALAWCWPAQSAEATSDRAVADLIKQLDSESFAARQEAEAELLRLGKPALAPLKEALAGKGSLELRVRVEALVRKLQKTSRARELRERLVRPDINLENGFDANTPLRDALQFLSDRHDVPLYLDSSAFAAAGVNRVDEFPVQLPKLTVVSLATILRQLLDQLKLDQGYATCLIRTDGIFVTTSERTRPGEWTAERRHLAPRVSQDFCLEPLEDALQHLADTTGISIVLDARVSDAARKRVTAAFSEVPLDSVVRLLADMADLKAVVVDNALYVTTPENARAAQAAERRGHR